MRRSIIIAIAILLLAGFVALLSADRIANDFAQSFKQDLAQSNIGLRTENAKTHFPLLLEYTKATFTFPTGFLVIPIELDLVKVQPYPSLLLFNQPSFDLYVKAYKGVIDASIRSELFDDLINARINVQDLELGQHPHLHSFGIQGRINLSSYFQFRQDEEMPDPRLHSSQLKLSVHNGEIAGGRYFADRLVLPRILDINIDLDASFELDQLQLNNAVFSSSLGSANGTGGFQYLHGGEPTSGNLSIKISLSAEGVEQYGIYFARFSEGRGTADQKNWEFVWSKSEGQAVETVLHPISR